MPEVRTTSSTGGQKGAKSARFDLIPIGPLTELAEHFGRGALKYDDDQWRKGYEWSKSYAALMRHLTAFWAGYDYDSCPNDPDGCSHVDAQGEPFEAPEPDTCFNHTGSHHMAAVAWHAFVLLEFKDHSIEHDDRYGFKADPEPGPLTKMLDRINASMTAGLVNQQAAMGGFVRPECARLTAEQNQLGPDLLSKRSPFPLD